MARYERLRGWALHLSGGDRAAAEDLLQEAFVQFTATNPDLGSIQNLDAYLFGLVRVLHLSQMRQTRRRARLLDSVLDYNAAILGLRHADPRDQVSVRGDLLRVCQYACARKETSKAGSVLLLRFFLGYYPREIARVMKSTREAVEERLRVARAEAKSYLRDPGSLKLIGASPAADARPAPDLDPSAPPDAFLHDMRRCIALSKRGECLPEGGLELVYRGGGTVGCATLAHLVSCEGCLDTVNRLLGLPPLAERHPVDAVGKDTGSGGGDGGGGGGEAADLHLVRGRARAREVFEHDPGELCVAVNGDYLCSQTVGRGRNEQTLNVEHQVEFAEVFSEQGVRMLLLVVGERPPGGPVRHTARADLSDGRSLAVALELNYPFSTLRVVYVDGLRQPAEAADPGPESAAREVARPPADALPSAGERAEREGGREPFTAAAWERLARWLTGGQTWLRPGVVTAVLSLLLVGALLFVRTRVSTVSAAELLSRSAVAERAAAGDRSTVTHRTVYLEQRDPAGATRRQRIEVWHSEARRVTVRRVYDETGGFVIGERVTADGERVVLTADAKSAAVREARPAAAALVAAGAAWRLSPSAIDYLDLTGGAAFAAVEERGADYVVRNAGRADAGVVEAVLILRKADLHAVEMRLVYSGEAGRREYRFVESLFERPPPGQTPPQLFEAGGDAPGADAVGGGASARGTAAAGPAPPARASAELEVELNYLLDRLGVSPGEQVSVRRTSDDRLRVEALVETAERKRGILAALAPFVGNPAVSVEVSTVAEALAGRGRQRPGTTTELEVQIHDDARETEAELARKLAGDGGGGEGRAREEVARVGEQLLADSRQAVRHSAALVRLTASFPSRVGNGLDPAAREKLRRMIRTHAEACLRNARAVERGLAAFSPPARRGAGQAPAITNDAEMARAVERLSRLTRESDEALRAAFTLSQRGQSLAPIKSARFWESLEAAERLSLAILQASR